MGITEILKNIWLFSANKTKSSESFSKQPTQLIVKLNSSLQHIIVTLDFRNFVHPEHLLFYVDSDLAPFYWDLSHKWNVFWVWATFSCFIFLLYFARYYIFVGSTFFLRRLFKNFSFPQKNVLVFLVCMNLVFWTRTLWVWRKVLSSTRIFHVILLDRAATVDFWQARMP